MDFSRFKRIIETFADTSKDLDVSRGRIVAEVHGDIIDAKVSIDRAEIVVDEMGVRKSALEWIVERIAQLRSLAERIVSETVPEPYFVVPSGEVLKELSVSPEENRTVSVNSVSAALEMLDEKTPGSTRLVYLTSDAGEGKTTVINEMARIQAQAFTAKKSNWILLPVNLMGRTFLRFDDVIVGALMNRYRFSRLYYQSLIELVRLGVIVPALDGFEEVFVESEGEALSAVGSLMNSLQSEGTLLIATRKAFYQFKNFASQAKLFDAIGEYGVDTSQLALKRWERRQFLEYTKKQGFANPEEIYSVLAERLGENHAFLSRAFLVKSLLTYLKGADNLEGAIDIVTRGPESPMVGFVNSLLEREVSKWIDKSGDVAEPLLTSREHHELLALIADEMWSSSTEFLSGGMLEGIAEIFSEGKQLSPSRTRQVRERIKQHALLIPAKQGRDSYSFDHEEFKNFFLGESIGFSLRKNDIAGLKNTLRRASLPKQTLETVQSVVVSDEIEPRDAIEFLMKASRDEFASSYVKENVGAIVLRLLHNSTLGHMTLKDLLFPQDALEGIDLIDVHFVGCIFQSTEIGDCRLRNVRFSNCRFDIIAAEKKPQVDNVEMERCEVVALYDVESGGSTYAPEEIDVELGKLGFRLVKPQPAISTVIRKPDPEIRSIEKVLRAFTRATAVNENVLRLKAGAGGAQFMQEVLPALLKINAIEEVVYTGSGRQKRYRLAMKMQTFLDALVAARGNYSEFLKHLSPG